MGYTGNSLNNTAEILGDRLAMDPSSAPIEDPRFRRPLHSCHCHADGKPGAGQGRGWWAHSSPCAHAQRGRRAATRQQPVARTERMLYHPCNRPAQGDHCTTVIPAPPRRGDPATLPPQSRRASDLTKKQSPFFHFSRFRIPEKKHDDNQPKVNNQMSLPPDGAGRASVAPGPAAVDRAAGLCRGPGSVQTVPSLLSPPVPGAPSQPIGET